MIGELALGNLHRRFDLLGMLSNLPQAVVANDAEVLQLIDNERLFGRGAGYIDVHLIAAARLSGAMLWTADRRLRTLAVELGMATP